MPEAVITGGARTGFGRLLGALKDFTAAELGGVAIKAGGNTIGGIGVSGAPGGQFDEECARAAIAKIQDRMK